VNDDRARGGVSNRVSGTPGHRHPIARRFSKSTDGQQEAARSPWGDSQVSNLQLAIGKANPKGNSQTLPVITPIALISIDPIAAELMDICGIPKQATLFDFRL
jgi:hypothetical protein